MNEDVSGVVKKDLNRIMSPVSGLIFFVGMVVAWIALFRPSALAFVQFVVVDGVATALAAFLMNKWFFARYPDYKELFAGVDLKKMRGLAYEEKRAFLRALSQYPRRRMLAACVTNVLKVIPGFLFIIYFWQYDRSIYAESAMIILLFTVANTYFCSLMYIESHRMMSDLIKDIHQRFDWSDTFRAYNPEAVAEEFVLFERLSYAGIAALMLAMVCMVILSEPARDVLILDVIVCFAGGFGLIARVWSLSRAHFFGGIRAIFERFSAAGFRTNQPLIPLHTTPELAQFEAAYNGMLVRLKTYENELAVWILKRAEETRYQTLGELSALFAHDLAQPIHVLNFCIHEIIQDPSRAKDEGYRNQLAISAQQCIDMVTSMREFLKRPDKESLVAEIWMAHTRSATIVRSQFSADILDQIAWRFDENLMGVSVNVPMQVLIHVLQNLYSNAIKSFLKFNPAHPKISIEMVEMGQSAISFSVCDNGSGISPELFERITLLSPDPSQEVMDRDSLGLRLARRVIEHYNGSISVSLSEQSSAGAKITLNLPRIREAI